jgi:hypothetical protein
MGSNAKNEAAEGPIAGGSIRPQDQSAAAKCAKRRTGWRAKDGCFS